MHFLPIKHLQGGFRGWPALLSWSGCTTPLIPSLSGVYPSLVFLVGPLFTLPLCVCVFVWAWRFVFPPAANQPAHPHSSSSCAHPGSTRLQSLPDCPTLWPSLSPVKCCLLDCSLIVLSCVSASSSHCGLCPPASPSVRLAAFQPTTQLCLPSSTVSSALQTSISTAFQ